jgi:L-ascorbate metabolism protein UlaG (beta-lactamase superfamily)
MKIKYLAHSCFLFTGSDGLRVLFDPYKSGAYDGAIGYAPIRDEADIVVVTHDHPDHSAVEEVPGNPLIVRRTSTARGVRFEAIEVPHDREEGRQRGKVSAFTFEMDSIRICHLSDIGGALDEERRKAIGEVDILLVPVGGVYTLGGDEAYELVAAIQPSLAIPMHFKTPRIGFPLEPVDIFLKHYRDARRPGRCEIEVSTVGLPESTRVIVLDPAN